MNRPRVGFILKANNKIGLGHLIRTVSIARKLDKLGIDSIFFSLERDLIAKIISDKEFHYSELLENGNFMDLNGRTSSFTRQLGIGICVVDLLEEDLRDLSLTLKKLDVPIGYISTYNKLNQVFSFDFIIYPGFLRFNSGPNQTKVFQGLEYLPLRKEIFMNKPKEMSGNSGVNKIMICMGGTDPENNSVQLLSALERIGSEQQVNMIIGPGYVFHKEIEIVVANNKLSVNLFKNPKDFFKIALNNDVAIIPGGGLRYELAYLGIPLMFYGFDLQQQQINSAFVEKFNLGVSLGYSGNLNYHELESFLSGTGPEKLKDWSTRLKTIVSPNGAQNCAEVIKNGLRNAG